ncbi:PAS domain S-box protein [Devosia sp. PTR5]|uniref:Blue-light-activated histidine kinase n=1 Tax=Devosia oryzisoli TaxID=2774138 RepID=A0A927FXW1_9HYPH|nr:HWE histidine kinase domain-containing protein [Devosia oryzisoli]MBD8067287.1 PAS domain S-box protein [Devosia oryzisoli]
MSTEDQRIEHEMHRIGATTDPFAAAVRATRMPMLITDPNQPDNPIVFMNDAFTKLTGYTREEALGRNCRFLQGPGTSRDDVTRVRNAVARREAIEIDLLNYRKDGSSFWNRLLLSPVFDQDGKLSYFFASQFDVSPDRRRVSELQMTQGELESEIERRMLDLTASEGRLRFILQAAQMGIWNFGMQSRTLLASARTKAIFGREAGDVFSYADMMSAFSEADQARWEETVQSAAASGAEFVIDCRLVIPEQEERWVELRGQVNRDAIDSPLSVLGVAMDITERKYAEEHSKLLARELNHRVKNSLATAQAVFSQSLRSARDLTEASDTALGRIQALSTAQDLLTKEGWSSATMRDVVDRALAPFASDRVRVAGPRVLLGARAVSTLSMALHELATNAAKYGALSGAQGSVTITWSIETTGVPQMRFYWSEMDGPPVSAPSRRGFGSRLIEDTVAIELNGTARIDYRPEGVKYEITAPLPDLAQDVDAYAAAPEEH